MSSRPHKYPKLVRPHRNRVRRKLSLIVTFVIMFMFIGSYLLITSFAATSEPSIAKDPPVPLVCGEGLDIALVADVSGSERQYLPQIKSAYLDFVNGLLPGTKTEISLTDFSADGQLLQGFTSDPTKLDDAINGMQIGSDTNWQAGLTTGYDSFSGGRAGVPEILIIATDGVPTDPRDPGQGGGGGGGQLSVTALYDAMDEANIIKGKGVHMLAIGIGNVDQQNLVDITGSDANPNSINADVLTAGYDSFAQTMASIAHYTCGGGNSGGGGNGNNSGGNGSGASGNGNGSGGNGSGVSGNGNGSGGNGSGGNGNGSGKTGTKGTGGSNGKTVSKSPSPSPSTTKSTAPTPVPTITTSTLTAPAPSPTPTPLPSTNQAPTPTAQGTQVKPPEQQPSPFFDGQEFSRGSVADTLDSPAVGSSKKTLWMVLTVAAVVLLAGGYMSWRKKLAIIAFFNKKRGVPPRAKK